MPILSRFSGLIIKMYLPSSNCYPPHIHVIHEENDSLFDINTGKVIEGDLSDKDTAMIKKWIQIHHDELMKIWETQEFIYLK